MSVRAIWTELVRLRREGQDVVSLEHLKTVHYLAVNRISKMVRAGDVERVGKGQVRIVDARVPP